MYCFKTVPVQFMNTCILVTKEPLISYHNGFHGNQNHVHCQLPHRWVHTKLQEALQKALWVVHIFSIFVPWRPEKCLNTPVITLPNMCTAYIFYCLNMFKFKHMYIQLPHSGLNGIYTVPQFSNFLRVNPHQPYGSFVVYLSKH